MRYENEAESRSSFHSRANKATSSSTTPTGNTVLLFDSSISETTSSTAPTIAPPKTPKSQIRYSAHLKKGVRYGNVVTTGNLQSKGDRLVVQDLQSTLTSALNHSNQFNSTALTNAHDDLSASSSLIVTPPRPKSQPILSPPAITYSNSRKHHRSLANRAPPSFKYIHATLTHHDASSPTSPSSPQPVHRKSNISSHDSMVEDSNQIVVSSVTESESYAEKHLFMQRYLSEFADEPDGHPSERLASSHTTDHHHLQDVDSRTSPSSSLGVTSSSIFDFSPSSPTMNRSQSIIGTRNSGVWNDLFNLQGASPQDEEEFVLIEEDDESALHAPVRPSNEMLSSSLDSITTRRVPRCPSSPPISCSTSTAPGKTSGSSTSHTPLHFPTFIPVNTPNHISLYKMEQLLDQCKENQPPACIILQPFEAPTSCAPSLSSKRGQSVNILSLSILIDHQCEHSETQCSPHTTSSPNFHSSVDSISTLNDRIPFYFHQILFQLRKYVPVIICHNSSTDFLFSVRLFNLLLNENQCHELYILDCSLQELEKKRTDLFISHDEHQHRISDENWIQTHVKTVHDMLFRNLGTHSSEWISVSPPTKILRHLYVGCARNSFEQQQLLDLNVSGVINAATECESHFPNTFQYLKCNVDDHPHEDIAQYFEATYQFIERSRKQKKVCFVHCFVGASRSVTIVVAYLMRKKNWSFKKAYRFVSKRRTETDVNFGFCQQLMEYEKVLSSQSSKIEPGSPTSLQVSSGASLL
mmetsp:Transcript_6653/g.24896  ORF Transcript_6653/g.24896 Transcript_6653/m.24896 type:complete len:753 (-) Transcript_6653:33-2291(-)